MRALDGGYLVFRCLDCGEVFDESEDWRGPESRSRRQYVIPEDEERSW